MKQLNLLLTVIIGVKFGQELMLGRMKGVGGWWQSKQEGGSE